MSEIVAMVTGLGSALGVGFASAIVPIVNAEAVVGSATVALSTRWAFPIAVVVAVGQSTGKLLLFEAGRRVATGGRSRLARRGHAAKPRPAWQVRLVDLLRQRRQGRVVVLLSASVGLPPLALVSVAAGAARSSRGDFLLSCLAGRVARFLVLAWVVAAAAA